MSEPAPFARVVEAWRDLRAASARLEKRDRLATLFAALAAPLDLRLAVGYLSGEVSPAPLGVGWALWSEALAAAPPEPSGPPLALRDLDAAATALATTSGRGARARRLALLGALLARAAALERELLAALFGGELRQGAQEALVLEGLARAFALAPEDLRRAAMLTGSLPEVAAALRREGPAALRDYRLRPLVPVAPMLAASAGRLAEDLAELGGEAAAEWKLDGVRVQVHRLGDEVRVFTRSLKDATAAMPAVVALARGLPVESVVLDGEALARDAAGRPLELQDLLSRVQQGPPGGAPDPAAGGLGSGAPGAPCGAQSRSGDALPTAGAGALEALFFDLLYLDGEPLIDRPHRERRAALERLLPAERCIPRVLVRTPAEAEAVLREARAQGHEGLVLKALDAPYAAGRRGSSWRKLKPAATVDLVVLGAEWGHGRRQGWLSNLHLGARDPQDPARFFMVGKTFKGLTDAMLAELTATLPPLALEAPGPPPRPGQVLLVRPERVVEVAFEGAQRSARYAGGLALRFARVRRLRPDRGPREASTLDEVRALGARGEPAGRADEDVGATPGGPRVE